MTYNHVPREQLLHTSFRPITGRCTQMGTDLKTPININTNMITYFLRNIIATYLMIQRKKLESDGGSENKKL